jgi:hypothetical protein
MNSLNNDFLEEHLEFTHAFRRGCALLGKTAFDKLEAIRGFLSDHGFIELGGKDKTDRGFVVINCRKEAQDSDSILKIAERYQSTPYVIFNNCEDILRHDDVLRVFAYLLDPEEYEAPFFTESFYVFLGGENTISQNTDSPAEDAVSDHIASFCHYIPCYDFDAEEQYSG